MVSNCAVKSCQLQQGHSRTHLAYKSLVSGQSKSTRNRGKDYEPSIAPKFRKC